MRVVGAVLIVLGASVGVGWVMRLVGGRGPMGPDRAVTLYMPDPRGYWSAHPDVRLGFRRDIQTANNAFQRR